MEMKLNRLRRNLQEAVDENTQPQAKPTQNSPNNDDLTQLENEGKNLGKNQTLSDVYGDNEEQSQGQQQTTQVPAEINLHFPAIIKLLGSNQSVKQAGTEALSLIKNIQTFISKKDQVQPEEWKQIISEVYSPSDEIMKEITENEVNSPTEETAQDIQIDEKALFNLSSEQLIEKWKSNVILKSVEFNKDLDFNDIKQSALDRISELQQNQPLKEYYRKSFFQVVYELNEAISKNKKQKRVKIKPPKNQIRPKKQPQATPPPATQKQTQPTPQKQEQKPQEQQKSTETPTDNKVDIQSQLTNLKTAIKSSEDIDILTEVVQISAALANLNEQSEPEQAQKQENQPNQAQQQKEGENKEEEKVQPNELGVKEDALYNLNEEQLKEKWKANSFLKSIEYSNLDCKQVRDVILQRIKALRAKGQTKQPNQAEKPVNEATMNFGNSASSTLKIKEAIEKCEDEAQLLELLQIVSAYNHIKEQTTVEKTNNEEYESQWNLSIVLKDTEYDGRFNFGKIANVLAKKLQTLEGQKSSSSEVTTESAKPKGKNNNKKQQVQNVQSQEPQQNQGSNNQLLELVRKNQHVIDKEDALCKNIEASDANLSEIKNAYQIVVALQHKKQKAIDDKSKVFDLKKTYGEDLVASDGSRVRKNWGNNILLRNYPIENINKEIAEQALIIDLQKYGYTVIPDETNGSIFANKNKKETSKKEQVKESTEQSQDQTPDLINQIMTYNRPDVKEETLSFVHAAKINSQFLDAIHSATKPQENTETPEPTQSPEDKKAEETQEKLPEETKQNEDASSSDQYIQLKQKWEDNPLLGRQKLDDSISNLENLAQMKAIFVNLYNNAVNIKNNPDAEYDDQFSQDQIKQIFPPHGEMADTLEFLMSKIKNKRERTCDIVIANLKDWVNGDFDKLIAASKRNFSGEKQLVQNESRTFLKNYFDRIGIDFKL